jgi:fermentation-respiration switch protein FrsA (DUF1100 family)
MPLLRSLLPYVLAGGGIYALLVLLVFVTQARMLYFPDMPGRQLQATPAALGLDFEDVRFTASDGVALHGWFVPASGARATVVFCHGNAGNISHRLDWLRILHGLDLNVLLFDYRGYGESAGSPTEEGSYRDAEAAWAYVTGKRGARPGEVILFGESLGGAVAAQLATRVTPGVLVLHSAFTSVPDLAAYHYWFLPVRALARFRYSTAEYLAQINAPVLVIHSRDDEIVPFGHGRALYERAREPRRLVEIAGDHNGGFLRSEALLVRGLREFLNQHVNGGST